MFSKKIEWGGMPALEVLFSPELFTTLTHLDIEVAERHLSLPWTSATRDGAVLAMWLAFVVRAQSTSLRREC